MTKKELKLFGAKDLIRVTLTLDFLIRDYESSSLEDLIEEWFKQYPLNMRSSGHVYRDNCLLGGSEEIISIEIDDNL